MTRLFRAATMTMLVVGCTNSATTTSLRTNSTEPAERLAEVTLHVAGMNERLQVLWSDWPNKVKQALAGLEGVESVEDEWERGLESDESLDVLFVTYDTQRVTVDNMLATVAQQEFEAKVQP